MGSELDNRRMNYPVALVSDLDSVADTEGHYFIPTAIAITY